MQRVAPSAAHTRPDMGSRNFNKNSSFEKPGNDGPCDSCPLKCREMRPNGKGST